MHMVFVLFENFFNNHFLMAMLLNYFYTQLYTYLQTKDNKMLKL